MKIISKYKDYYDCCSSLGIDHTLIYKRELQAYENSECVDILLNRFNLKNSYGYSLPHLSSMTRPEHNSYHGISLFFIGFCGKFYPMFKLRLHSDVVSDIRYFNLSQVDELKTITEHDEQYSRWFKSNKYNKKSVFVDLIQSVEGIQEQEWNEPFIHFNSPILVVNFKHGEGNSIIFSNAQLNKYNFQKVIDPYSAWQQITQYLNSVIPKQIPEIISISDKDRIVGHGFDEWSFRKKVR